MREARAETPHASTLVLDVGDWPPHLPGQHVDVRLTAEDGYQVERSYSIASAPEYPSPLAGEVARQGRRGGSLELTVERIEEGEVSPYLTDEVRPGDQFEVRGPIGGYFTWTAADGGPLLLIAGGSGLVPLMSMLRHRQAVGSGVDAAMLREVGPDPDQGPRTYVCGPTPFVETVADLLVQVGHAPATVRTERFGPTGG